MDLVELLGAGYVIDSVVASYNRKQHDELFRNYVTDGLYALVNHDLTYVDRFIHMVEQMEHRDSKEEKQESASDIKARMKAKIAGGNAT